MNVRVDVSEALVGLHRVQQAVLDGVADYGGSAAADWERYAKENRPWTDRTGNARRTLEGRFETVQPGRLYRVGIVGHMPYSVHLELSHGQRFAILYPTVNALAARTLRGWADTVASLR